MNTENFKILRDTIAALEPEQVEMDHVLGSREYQDASIWSKPITAIGPGCNTAGCMLGWGIVILGKLHAGCTPVHAWARAITSLQDAYDVIGEDDVIKWLDVSDAFGHALFYTPEVWSVNPLLRDLAELTKDDVLAELDYIIEHGEI